MGRPFRPPISSGPGVLLSRSSKQAWLPLRRRPGSRVANSQHTEAKPDVTASTRVKDNHRKRIRAAYEQEWNPPRYTEIDPAVIGDGERETANDLQSAGRKNATNQTNQMNNR